MKPISTMLACALVALAIPGGKALRDGGWMPGPKNASGNATTAEARDAPAPAQQFARAEAPRTQVRRHRDRRGKATIEADARGHFHTVARINRREIEVLVDTGASSVAMSNGTARSLGVRVKRDAFVHTANTANGRVSMALSTLDRVRIGGIELRDVEVAVLPDGALDGVLLGMSFLGRLEGFRVEDGVLVMER